MSVLLAGCTQTSLEETRFPMGTIVRIKVWGTSRDTLDSAILCAFDEIDRVDSLTSVFSESSAVHRLNKEGKLVSSELAGLLGTAGDVWARSRGAFDPTVMPLVELWGFYDTARSYVPSQKEISEALRLVNYDLVGITGDTVFFKADSRSGTGSRFPSRGVDLGGIAKGYAVDRAVRILQEKGVHCGLVDAGGDIFCFGKKKKGWKIGIRNPRGMDPQDLLGIITLDSGAVATSGDYENYFESQGVRYHHLIDPKTGLPARGQVSATVTAPTAALADAWATALFVLGKDGIALLDSIEGIEGMLVLDDGSVITTKYFPKIKKP